MHPFVLLGYSVWIIAVTTFLSMRRSDAVDHECQGRIFGLINAAALKKISAVRSAVGVRSVSSALVVPEAAAVGVGERPAEGSEGGHRCWRNW
jgi:hypothetical protein